MRAFSKSALSEGKEKKKPPKKKRSRLLRGNKKKLSILDSVKILKITWIPLMINESGEQLPCCEKNDQFSRPHNHSLEFQNVQKMATKAMSLMSTGENSQDATDFSGSHFNISEDSNSEPPFKKKLAE
ncbi:unnamed protein product, partial [Meganyctiphanes norvegica]